MMKHKILWQEFLLVWKCIHVTAWVSWISLFLAYLRYFGFFNKLLSSMKLYTMHLFSDSILNGVLIVFETFIVPLFSLTKRLNIYDRKEIFVTE